MRQHRAAATVAAVFLLCTIAPAQRLPRTAIPEHYDIHLAPDFATDSFAGDVRIVVTLRESMTAITLNVAELDIHSATIDVGGREQPATVSLDAAAERATFTAPSPMPAGRVFLSVRYTGSLNDRLRGFYLSRASNREYAVTQLEATDARRAFPSFDEPAMKATFAVSTTIAAADTAISNGPIVSDTPGPQPGKHTIRFATTKRMSPYLVALLVGDWECIAGSADRIPIRICGTPGRQHELGFALEAAQFALRYFNRYFAIDYPFGKLDIIAVPDFSAGAMENTGAIVFRDQFLLVSPETSSNDHLRRVVQYIGHEIAHQWFGDLVTMQWWDDIWLNEGFATWMEHRPMEEWKPEWNARLQEVRDTERAMAVDMLRTTRAIRTPVDTPAEINEVFDAIAYEKTAAVIRMVEGYVGVPAYRGAINAYLEKFAYANTTGEGLWTILAAHTRRPVDRILSGFITKASMPLIEIDLKCAGGASELSLTQTPMSNAVPDTTVWDVPVCYKRSLNGRTQGEACTLLSERTRTIALDGCSDWLIGNADSRGYYRVGYTDAGMRALRQAMRNGHVTPVEQTSVINDLWALVWLNQRGVEEFLALTAELLRAPPTPAIETALSRINLISDRFIGDSLRAPFEEWVRRSLTPLASQFGWTPAAGESDERRDIRESVLFTLGYAGRDPAVLAEAARLADAHLSGRSRLEPGMAGTVMHLAALDGDADLYDRYVAGMMDAPTRAEQTLFRNALSYFTDPALTRRTLVFATSADVRAHDAPDIISGLMSRRWSTSTAWDHLKDSWERLERSMGIFQALPSVVESTRNFCATAARDDVDRFFREHVVAGTERTLARSLEAIERCATAKSAQADRLAAFLIF